ncbi:MAG: ATP-binding protein [Atopobiaceae bacterium]|nr:ATP-binding protein [Atopobiaceae bacterium]
MDTVEAILVPLITLAMFATPALLVSAPFPRRNHFEVRVAACLAVMLAIFVFWQPAVDLSTSEYIPVGDFVFMAVFFAATLANMMLVILICHRVSAMTACYATTIAYTVQNLGSGVSELVALLTDTSAAPGRLFMMLRMVVFCFIAFALYYLLVTRRISREAPLQVPGKRVFTLFLTVILVSIVFDMGVKRLPGLGLDMSYLILFRVTQIVMVITILALEFELLYSSSMKVQNATIERLMRDREAQYELSRDTIDAINLKMHDIRHQIRHLEDGSEGATVLDKDVLRDIAREVNVYDTHVTTGNDALDTILTEKTLLGSREGISLACIADGSSLVFMAPSDLYALFGNALENAFEAVRLLNDPEKRNISLLVRRVANMASIHIENYFEGEISYDSYGKLMSSKMDKEAHGYGVRSMQQIVERYGGTMTLSAEGQTFAVNILIPIPDGTRSPR